VVPGKPTAKSFEELVKLVKEHRDPPPSTMVRCFKFNSQNQKEGETVAEFVAELRRLSEHCKFNDTLDNMLKDRLVCGIHDGHIQRRLLAEPDLTLKRTFKLSQAAETADRNAKDLQGGLKPKPSQILAVHQTSLHQLPQSSSLLQCY
jgi:hypothetical protein